MAGKPNPNRGKKLPVEPLTREEARALIAACSPRSKTGVRNRALLATLYRGGLRCSEALDLFPKDVDVDAGAVTVLHGKGDKRRVVGIDPGTCALIERWLELRKSLGISRGSPLYCTLHGSRLYSSYVRELLPRLARRAGIEKRVHAHGLRHTMAFELMRDGVPLKMIQQQLGHSTAAVTDRYLDHLSPAETIAAMQAREPLEL